MVKMLFCMLSAMAIAVVVLQLRQQRLELNYKISSLHRQVEEQQAKLWNQQLQIATYTAPNAIEETVKNKDLMLVPRSNVPTKSATVSGSNPDAE